VKNLNTFNLRLLMLAIHLAAIPVGIVLGRWVFEAVS
jgi:hypothetical protein